MSFGSILVGSTIAVGSSSRMSSANERGSPLCGVADVNNNAPVRGANVRAN